MENKMKTSQNVKIESPYDPAVLFLVQDYKTFFLKKIHAHLDRDVISRSFALHFKLPMWSPEIFACT